MAPVLKPLPLALLLAALSPACGGSQTQIAPPDAGSLADASAQDASDVDAGVFDSGATIPTGPTDEQILATEWTRLSDAPLINGKQDDIFFINPQRGWSVNGLGDIYRTDNGGQTWTHLLHQEGTFFRAVLFTSETRGFVTNVGTGYYPNVTDSTPMYETRDGGETWTPVTTISGPLPDGICNFTQLDEEHIVAVGRVGGPSFVVVSRDGGETWTSSEVTRRIAVLIDGHFSSAMEGVLLGGTSRNPSLSHTVVLHTYDGGTSWREVFRSEQASELGWKLSFPTDLIGYASVLSFNDTSSFLKTTDGGRTWQQLPMNVGPYEAKGIGFINERIGWIGGERPGKPAYRTEDGGQTWQRAPGLGLLINRFRFVDPWTGYAIGNTVYKFEVPRP